MIILDTVGTSLEVVLAAPVVATECPIYAAFVDVLSADQSVAALASVDAQTNGVTPVTAPGAPAAGHTRTVKFLSVRNSDSAAVVCTVRLNRAGTRRILWGGTLDVGDTLQYED